MGAQMIGDMSQHFQSLRQGSAIKGRLNTLAKELSTGRVSDLSTHLRGDTSRLSLIDREVSMIDAFDQAGAQLALNLSQKQLVLSTLDSEQTTLAARLVTVTPSSALSELSAAESAGRSGFNRMADLLNTRLSDRSLFAGTAVDGPAVADGEVMLADILGAIGSATDATTITAAIEAWFDDPAGGFATMAYRGATGPAAIQRFGAQESIAMNSRADDPGMRNLLKAGAFAAVSDALSGTLDAGTRARLVGTGGSRIFTATDAVRQTAARIGDDEQRLEEAATRHAAQRTTFGVARNALVLADPFDTASLLQSVQQQLELHYTATARLSRLSLANYL